VGWYVIVTDTTRRVIHERLQAERGGELRCAGFRVAVAYPAPYAVAMSSLGYQWVYRLLQHPLGVAPERVFLPDGGDRPGAQVQPAVSYEGLRPLAEFPLIAFSIAYELELASLIKMLEVACIPPRWSERDDRWPLVIAGGPLTFSNPQLLAPFVDAVVVGEAEGILEEVVTVVRAATSREQALRDLAQIPHVFVPVHHGAMLPESAVCAADRLPAVSVIRTEHAELRDMLLIEAERGCARDCAYCVMRRCPGRSMRVVPRQVVLERVPVGEPRVGLVGAAVTDHPEITALVRDLAQRGSAIGLSSLRPDRLDEDLVVALRTGGYRTLTTALDGASERLRARLGRRCHEQHFVRVAELARQHRMARLKLYLMLGVPDETSQDIDECVRFVSELSRILPVALSVAPFCAKRGTPLDGSAYAGVRTITGRIRQLHRGLRGRADVRAASVRWGWVEHVLSQGGVGEAVAVAEAEAAGGSFNDYRTAFERLGWTPQG